MAKPSTSLLKRRLDIAEIVRKNGEIKVDDLAEMLAVSGVTIRNDLNYLEQQGYFETLFWRGDLYRPGWRAGCDDPRSACRQR